MILSEGSQDDFGQSYNRCKSRKLRILYLIGIAFGGVLLGFLPTYFSMKNGHTIETIANADSVDRIRSKLLENVDSHRIRNWLKELTKRPQLAGTSLDKQMAEFILNEWRQMGINESNLVGYRVLLSYANASNPNVVQRVHQNGSILFRSSPIEDPLTANAEERPYYELNPPYLAYAKSTNGTPVRANLVYVNYGRAQDYRSLKLFNISVANSIAIARYGKIFRGNILQLAADNGAIGVILYGDPSDYTDGNVDNTYPHSVYLPQYGAQRGTTQLNDGDPLTPFYPSIDSAYRLPLDEANLPLIPAHCVGYGDALRLMAGLKGPTADKLGPDWTGGLNMTYRVGPGYVDNGSVTLEVNSVLETRVVYNVIAVIRGCVESDRYVLLGNHRDSWSFGAVDPSSGTAAMLAVSQAITNAIRNENWCPRRTIVLCSWGAEEFGLVGSTEWVQQNQKLLRTQAVAYINVDNAVSGNYTFTAGSTPLLYRAIWEATERVPNPDPNEVYFGRKTVYDTWKYRMPWNISGQSMARVVPLAGLTDYRSFLQISGVPVIDFRYRCDVGSICNPNYHTMYETFNIQENLMDRGFKVNKAVAQVWVELVRSLSDSVVLPLSLDYYPTLLVDSVNDLSENQNFQAILNRENLTLDYLSEAVNEFELAANKLSIQLETINKNNALMVRRVNDVLMLLERMFLDDRGLPLSAHHKHVIIAPSARNSYNSPFFPGIYDLMWKYIESTDNRDYKSVAIISEQIRKHISVITFHVNSAANFVNQTWF